MKREISVAFQGGGARLIGLISAANALSDLEKNSAVTLRAISGSSAGAIAAFLLAANVNFDHVRSALRKYDPIIRHQFPRLNAFQSYIRFIKFLISGSTIYRYEDLYGAINVILESVNIDGRQKISDLHLTRKVFITYSDIYAYKFDYARDNEPIATALARACALPIVFSSFNDIQSHTIDGGIFDNLPTELLVDNNRDLCPIFAVGFKPDKPKLPKSAASYLYSLAYSGIQHRIASSKKLIGEDMVLELSTTLGTLDFDQMVSVGIEKEYSTIKDQTRSFFQAYLSGDKVFNDPLSESLGPAPFYKLKAIEQSIYEYVLDSVSKASCVNEYVKMRVNAFSLANPSAYDEIIVEQVTKFLEGDYIKGIILPMTSGAGYAASIECKAFVGGPDGAEIKCQQILINKSDSSFARIGGHTDVVLLFQGDVKPLIGESVYVIKKQKRYGFMADLRDKGIDYLAVRCFYWPASEVGITLSIPRAFPMLCCKWHRENCDGPPPTPMIIPDALIPVDYISYSQRLVDLPLGGRLKGTFSTETTFSPTQAKLVATGDGKR